MQDRIRELRRVPASQLHPNPRNWRTHPPAQAAAMRDVLDEIGYAGALLARERNDGSLELIDGHLRAETTPDAIVPVLVLDVSAEEADKILLTHDPLGAMADVDRDNLCALLEEFDTPSDAVGEMLTNLAKEAADLKRPNLEPPDFQRDFNIPESFQVVIECAGEEDQREVYERMQIEGRKCRLMTM